MNMDYIMSEIINDFESKHTAGSKARTDIETILSNNGFNILTVINEKYDNGSMLHKIKHHYNVYKNWIKVIYDLKENDVVLIQFPLMNSTIFIFRILRYIRKKKAKSIIVIHDLESLRIMNRHDVSKQAKIRLFLEEKMGLKECDAIIAHNSEMIKILRKTYSNKTIVNLEIFDYLVKDNSKYANASYKENIVIAGNLSKIKSKYIYSLPGNVSFNLYGINYEKDNRNNINYQGSFDSEEIYMHLSGSFGLIWDGDTIETCSGNYGEYLKYNNPHKTSLYIASGLPIIIWKEAALAKYVKENNLGICVENLNDINKILEKLTNEDYESYKNNTINAYKKLRNGYYILNAIQKVKDLL